MRENHLLICISRYTNMNTGANMPCIELAENFLLVAFSFIANPTESHFVLFLFSMWPRCEARGSRDRVSWVTTIVSSFAHSSFAGSILTHDLAYFHTASFRSHYMTSVGWICVHFGQQTKHKHDRIQISRLHLLLLFDVRLLRINFKFGITFFVAL